MAHGRAPVVAVSSGTPALSRRPALSVPQSAQRPLWVSFVEKMLSKGSHQPVGTLSGRLS